ncbi:hypothetical protein F0562_007259 [Nyssa sinensis]|uniref:Uncharacterized protein n=1 Tax=Nyssa sinensis TaxID=561372 RepID=A0A5J5A5F8_9ASTE|nr:hypothetical protein F0562_007259 [Nyssa sinensis]
MEDIESASAKIERWDSAANAETETENSSLNDIENQYNVLVSHIGGMLEGVESTSSLGRCIYRVPIQIRKLNEAAYTPRIVSIGPFHHGSERLQFMEAEKLRYLKKLIERGDKRLEDYVRLVKKLEERIHRCYGETYRNNLPLSSNDFLTMVLVDAGFIIELLLRFNFRGLRDENEQLFKTWIRRDLMHDLILLENQIPFFVLEEFFNLTFASFPDNFPSLLQFTLWVFKSHNEQNKLPNFEVRHFTDLIRTFYLPTSSRLSPRAGEEFKFLHSATELHEAGVKFKVGSSKCLLDIKFKNGVLEMPCFKLYDSTIAIIRNLMALEQCHYFDDSYIIDYIFLLDCLINTPKDVDLLVQNGILMNWLGDSETTATLFNKFCTEIIYYNSNFYFSRLCEDLNAYYKVPRHMWKATLKRDYFSTPWRIASTIAATILLVLTFVQTENEGAAAESFGFDWVGFVDSIV